MAYNKFVISGDQVELYEYEKNLSIFRKVRVYNANRNVGSLLGVGGENTFSERELGKRRDNAFRSRGSFRRLVRSNLDGFNKPVLVTITYAENQTDLRRGYFDFTSFVQSLRYHIGKEFKYIAVPEFQERGAVHFHALMWGISEKLVLSERQTRFFAKLWGKGFIYLTQTDGNERLSSYLAKYMTKAYLDPRLRSCKAYVASRNILRPRVLSGVSPIWPVFEDLGLSTFSLLHSREYVVPS